MNIPTYALVAFSNSGKTTFLEKLIPALKSRGLRVAVIKHDGHDFQLDKEGKDSWRITQAGADVTAIVSATHAAIMENRPVPLPEIVERIGDVDLRIVEGGKYENWPKIMLYRVAAEKPMAADPDQCFAVVTDADITTTAPVFTLDDADGLADLIYKTIKE